MKAWHFISNDRRLGYGDNRIVKTGMTYKAKGEIELCRNGMHGSKRAIDALGYACGNIICEVDITGQIKQGDDKIVGRRRKVIWMRDVTNILHEFACRCAEDSLKLVPKPDPISLAAIKAKRDWLDGKISDEELKAVRESSWEASLEAARGAVRETAWDAACEAARDAALEAAREAVREAVREAARAAAWDAAREAARAAAWDAAREAARDKQNRRLTAMVCSGRKQ